MSQYFNQFNNYIFIGPKFRQRFLCEVRVGNFTYVGAGNSTNKKDAEKNASRDFVNFLVRTGKIKESEVPQDESQIPIQQQGSSNNTQENQNMSNQGGYNNQQSSSGMPQNFSANDLGTAYRPYNNDNKLTNDPRSYMDRAQQQARMDEAESLDINAAIHGNWTIENAKSKLNQFMQTNKVQGEYKFTPVGSDHNR